MKTKNSTITAIATPLGRGGVGIVRISGPQVTMIAQQIIGTVPAPRYAHYSKFFAADHSVIDEGIALYFSAPNSFTGEDILELQGHGGPMVMNMLLERTVSLGARLARPGEFSERAFFNDKLDLVQAEAIADLIDASSTQAARNAMNTFQGEFSRHIIELVQTLISLRVYVEAALDFPEEEIDFLIDSKLTTQLQATVSQLDKVLQSTKQGIILREGIRVVIAGKPNAGKSSLLNQLTGYDSAIVTDIPGTTRDVLRELIQIDGIPLHIIDTAGLRISHDQLEKEGIKRAQQEIERADVILLIMDAREKKVEFDLTLLPDNIPLIMVKNKIDLLNQSPAINVTDSKHPQIFLSAKTGAGLDLLKQQLKILIGYQTSTEGHFLARQRHLDALQRAKHHLLQGQQQLTTQHAGELLAVDLGRAQNALNEITGKFTSDDLLGKIFSSFCIGK